MRIRVWVASLALMALLIGAGVFFEVQDLGTASQWAGVASFLLAVVVAGVTAVGHLRGGRTQPPAGDVYRDIDVLQTGPGSVANYEKHVYGPGTDRSG
jgi:hypothetical protein